MARNGNAWTWKATRFAVGAAANQWGPTLTGHNPDPIIRLEGPNTGFIAMLGVRRMGFTPAGGAVRGNYMTLLGVQ